MSTGGGTAPALGGLRAGYAPPSAFRTVERLGKLSMVEVYVIAPLVIAVKGPPDGSSIKIHWAVGAFAISALLGIWTSYRLETRTDELGL